MNSKKTKPKSPKPAKSPTLSDLEAVEIGRRMLARTFGYEAFVDFLEEDICDIFSSIERCSKDRYNDAEDALTRMVVARLNDRFYDATHDEDRKGHVDLIVKDRVRRFEWLAEAKIYDTPRKHTGPGSLSAALDQLNKYANPVPKQDRGALLIYGYNENMVDVVDNWRKRLKNSNLAELSISDCPHRGPIGFVSIHKLTSGLKLRVWHVALLLYAKGMA